MFDIVRDQAKLGPSDFSKLATVSRVTVSLWFNGHANPHALLAKKVQRLVDAVEMAVKDGDLPVPHDVERRKRGLYIKNAVMKQLKRLAAPAA